MGMTNDGLSFWQAESEGTELIETTIGDLLDNRAEEIPTQEAVVYSCYLEFKGALDIRWSYAEFRERVNMVARGLMALGLEKGEHIAVWAANVPEWVLLEFAAAKAGLVLVTINPVYRAAEVEYVLKQGDVAALFFMAQVRDHNCLETIRSMVTPGPKFGDVSSERLPALRYTCLVGAAPPGLLESQDWRPALFKEMVAGGANISPEMLKERQAEVKSTDPALMLYTSGTTGFPKGAMLTHRGIINDVSIAMKRASTEIGQGDRYCLPMPFFHIAGSGIVVAIIASRMTLHPLLAFDPLKTLQIISTEGCSLIFAVPTMLIAMMQHPAFEQYKPTTLKVVSCGGAPVPVALMEQVKERMGADVSIVFGQTESTGGITITRSTDSFEKKSSTVGIPYPHVDVKIIDPATGKVVPVGERGELCCRGFLVMSGYYNMPEKTAEAIDSEGWLHTGDLATMDAEGYVNIVGRLKEMVIRGGENIFPREIEELLIRHPKVADAQVLGVPDAFFGEELLAVVLPKEGQQVTEEELRAFCEGQISRQKIPRYIQIVSSYPMTASGKVQKFVLREQAIKALRLESVGQTRTA
ncbi:MAG TPA: AMP-binding protein [Ktedonobacteraceae bacterium]|jgi:fatty-acyl-CoA synthase|nr:AMP-binding protein [Ktedonobacteraceae bacterium]